ncbi:unnamed protein product [Hymenolepis diminuta]|uniref:Uncharacterized protein n=1 Tax=Hymenolepis diminuta TaxID=6216 RepID=A0A564YNX8_HYMDI|nr:unnamed protein product [Hymenolepis diminuta]
MQPVSTCYRYPSSFYSYSPVETRFFQDSDLNYHFGSTEGGTYATVTNSHSKGSDVILLLSTTGRSAISVLHKLVVYQKCSLRTLVHNFIIHFAKFCSHRSIIQLRRSLAVL